MLASVQECEYNVCQSNTLHFRYIFVGDELCVCIRKKCWQVSQNVNVALRCNRYICSLRYYKNNIFVDGGLL